MKAIMILVIMYSGSYKAAGLTSEQIDYPDMRSCIENIDYVLDQTERNQLPRTKAAAYCLEVPK